MNAPIDISGVTLRTERLLLRPWRETDLGDFYEYAHVDGVGQLAGWMPHRDIEESRRILGCFIQGKKCFALEHQGKVIGSLGIETYSEEHYPELAELSGREIGYVLSRDHWGRGLMPEAVQAVISYLFETAQLDFILVGHFAWNRQSARVIEKCGFRYIRSRPYETQCGTVEETREHILYRRHFIEDFIAADGVSELLKVKINAMDDASFAQYLRFHYYTCEKPEHLGASNHLLFVGEK